MASTVEELMQQNEQLNSKIAVQKQQIDWLKRQLFGRKSEKDFGDHKPLFPDHDFVLNGTEGSSEEPEEPSKEEKKKGGQKRRIRNDRLPEDLPVRVIDVIPEEVLAAPDDWREINARSSDRLEKEPGYFYISRTVRHQFVRKDNPLAPPVIAPAAPTIIENGFWGSGLLCEILCNKYLYHLPFFRQEQLYRIRYGVDLSRKTMGDALEKITDQLSLVYDHLVQGMVMTAYLQMDETPVRYLDPTHPKGSSLGYLWTYRSPDGEVAFDWSTTREHANVEKFLKSAKEAGIVLKVLQSDGYPAYEEYIKKEASLGHPIDRAACLTHIRRKFEESRDQNPELVRWFLRQFKRLYRIEETLRENKAPPDLKERIRDRQSRRIIDLLEKAIDHLLVNSSRIRPKSNLGKALKYARGQWPAMQTYLEHGEVEIDNNLVENAIRPTAVGKKNHLFFGSPEAGRRSGIIYSLLLSAKAQGVDPQAYLRDLIDRLPTMKVSELGKLTPRNWAIEFKAAKSKTAG